MIAEKLKIAVISSKGGVGKSTISMQLILPYIFEKNGNQIVSHYEFDDENNDSSSYGASSLSKRKQVSVASPLLREELAEIFAKDESLCLDIGANKTTMTLIEALSESGMIHFLDLVVIPMLDGEQDAVNASFIYSVLKGNNPDLKFVFALNRVKSVEYVKHQFENYFGDVRGIFKNINAVVDNLFEEDKDNYLLMLDDEIIKYSRRFGLTIYEMSQQDRDFIGALKNSLSQASKEEEIKLLSFKNYISKSTQSYYKDVLSAAFRKMDEILEGENNE
ncbi:ParA family protein [Sulfurimonas sp. NWX79]|uniref:ParA family protein n=1 Tax=Sulfurimonas sp. NWX79 TaxID=2925412 RepID=UPI0032049F96